MTEMTKREFFEAIAKLEGIDAELCLFAEKEIAKMDERNAKRKAQPSKTAQANEPIKESICEFLKTVDAPVIAKAIGEAVEISTQKASALCRQLVEDGKLVASEEKVKGRKVKAYALA